ncbi:MAG: TonB-dependent receptor, partial [Bacteroidota bacterium]|nr:TonB-dependent receptor [Bacteroidota bacterium]
MKKALTLITIVTFLAIQIGFAQKTKTDANIFGHVIDHDGKHIPFATVSLVGTTIGTTTDGTGHYLLVNLPVGDFIIKAQCLGWKPKEVAVTTKAGNTMEIQFQLEDDVLGLEEVVITGDRNETKRTESSTIVNTITPKIFNTTQSVTLSEGLSFSPGLRMEANCNNCGFSQLRINGMEGPYSQILVNSRPIFSGLAGVYGLELIPSNMIKRVEVIRGGGSALYGSNAIAGTVNLILKDPIKNSFEFGLNAGLLGVGVDGSDKPAEDYSVTFNSSLITSDGKAGMSLFGFYRNRDPFDANNDGYSELTSINNTTVGTRLFHRLGTRSKLNLDFFHINEQRRGGDRHDYVVHMSNIAEALDHKITTGALTWDMFFREDDLLSVYASGQTVKRNSYYGAEQSLSDYGKTDDFSYTIGTQYNMKFKRSNLVMGIEDIGSWLKDIKQGYPDIENVTIDPSDSSIHVPYTENVIIADQSTNTLGIFAQYEINVSKLMFSIGGRFDHYSVKDKVRNDQEKNGNVISPRLTIKYDIVKALQARVSYSQGYRAPQIFDEDLHIETSGARRVIHVNDPGLRQETSHSFMASLDFNRQVGSTFIGLLLEGFYTQLNDPFSNEYSEPDESGNVIYTRVNAEKGARVQGVNIELNVVPYENVSLQGGFTIQSSKYEEPQEFNEKNFFRAPNDYGYL